VSDLSPLSTFPSGRGVDLTANPIDCASQAMAIASARARGVIVTTDCP
jgi:hypothetical protein